MRLICLAWPPVVADAEDISPNNGIAHPKRSLAAAISMAAIADIQDRDGAGIVIQAIHDLFPWLRHLFADSVYNGPNLRQALAQFGDWTIEIVTAPPGLLAFNSCRADGLSSEPSPGSIETADWQRTSRLNRRRHNQDLHRFHTASH